MHDNEVNNIVECNLLHDIINPPKLVKYINIHYYRVAHPQSNRIHELLNFTLPSIVFIYSCKILE